jgi:ribosomal protein L11 methyltransferase
MVVGTDVDESALESARQNAALDSAGTNIFFLNAGPGSWGPSFGFVVANILAEVLLALAPELAAAISPGGALCLSGFTPLQAPALRVAYERLGLVASAESVLDGWAVLLLRKPPAVAATNHIS